MLFLKMFYRSPGGTPLKKNDRVEDPSNPADIIAKALREKFQNSNMYRSPGKYFSSISYLITNKEFIKNTIILL